MAKKMKTFQLPKTVRVSGSNCSSFNSAHHTQFHFSVYQLVKAVDKQKLNLPDGLLKTWEECIDLETEINRQAMATVQTDRMRELDRQRDDLLTNLFGVVRAQRKSPVELIRNAAKELDKALGVYAGIQFESIDDETADIRGMLKDLERFADEVTALGLTPVQEQIKTINGKYQQLYASRQEKTMDLKLPSSREVRPQTDAAFSVVCQYIEASYLFATTIEDRELIERLVDRMNQEADRFKATHKLSAALKKAAGEKKPGDKKKPADDTKAVEKLLPEFEKAEGFAPGALKLTGKTAKGEGNAKLYELKSSAEETIWVKVEKDKLVKVPAPAATE